MTTWRTLASAAWCCAATALPGLLAAQAVPAQAELIHLAADVTDGRALWVNPAGLARRLEASAGAFVTAEDSGGVQLSQYGLQIASHGVAFGWQHDDFGATQGNLYVVGAALGDNRLSLGGAHRWYRRDLGNSRAWDLALHAQALPGVDLAVVWRDIGSPTAGDSVLEETLIASAGVQLLGPIHVSAEWRGATSGWATRRTRVGALLYLGRGLTLMAAQDFSSNANLRATAIGLQLGSPRGRVAALGRDGGSGTRQLGVGALSVTPPPRRGGFGR